LTEEHERVEDQLVSETHHKMRLIIGFNVALLLLGTVFLVALKRYFNYAIAAPLRKLAERSSNIAQGEFPENMPIASRDEIGLLSHSFNHMAERLKKHQEKLRGLAILEERERLACELHDSLAQDLACMRLKLIASDKSTGASQESIQELFTMVDEAYQDLRESIFGLRALSLRKNIGVVNALTEFLRDFSEVRKLPVELHVANPEAIQFAPQVEIQFMRILHEALTNMVKHARATRGKITITTGDHSATIVIEDDGRGFYPETLSEASLRFGLKTMNDRARSVGAELQLDSAPERGTKVTIRLPLVKPNHDEAHSAIIG
jgi:NarL family two-component system sensor histidine kinase LiaS